MNKRIIIGSDHGGFDYKQQLLKRLLDLGYEVYDAGTYTKESCDYPIFGEHVARYVSNGNADYGVVICTTGEGIMMAANKVKGVRCGIGYNDEVTVKMREHNDANVIAFGQKEMSYEDVERRTLLFLDTEFEGGRHARRVEIINNIK